MKTYPDKKFIQDVCWCCLATGELIILHITFERTMTKQVIECMTNLQVFDPRSWLWYVCLSATSLAASWRMECSITKRIYFSLGRGTQMSELPCVSLSLLPFIVQKITPCFMTRPTDLKLKKQITAQLSLATTQFCTSKCRMLLFSFIMLKGRCIKIFNGTFHIIYSSQTPVGTPLETAGLVLSLADWGALGSLQDFASSHS